MKTGLAILVLWVGLSSFNQDHAELRELWEASIYNEQKALDFSSQVAHLSNVRKDVQLAYRGMSYLMLCKHTGSVQDKYTNFVEGRELLERAISISPSNVEFRFLRFGVQTNTPAILQYYEEIESDRVILEKFLKSKSNQESDPWLYKCVSIYIQQQS